MSLEQFARAHVRKFIATMATQGLSRKRIANVLIPLRRALNEAVSDGYIDHNPVNDIELKSVQTKPRRKHEPDPFNPKEISAILKALARWPAVRWMYQFAFWTGIRPSEYIALRWSDVDWLRDPQPMMRVQRARGQIKMPKSDAGYRDVMLFPPALEALAAMKQFTLMKTQDNGDAIFVNPNTGNPWLSDKAPRETFWTPALRRAKVRYRDPYQCRHTYASMMLTASEPLGWVSKQLGHADTVITASTYVRWIEGFDPSVGSRVMAAWKDADKHSIMPLMPVCI